MNPTPSDRQWLTLHQVDDGEIWYQGGEWWAQGTFRNTKVTSQVRRLWQLGFIKIPQALTEMIKPVVTAEGMEVLKRRSVYDVLERLNSRQQ